MISVSTSYTAEAYYILVHGICCIQELWLCHNSRMNARGACDLLHADNKSHVLPP